MAGNRTAKSTSGAWDLVCCATGYSPIRDEKYPTPNMTWAVALDHAGMGLIVKEKLEEFLPPGTRFWKQDWIFELPKPWKSVIHVKSQEQGRPKLQGAGILKAWIDEQWPGQAGEDNVCEIRARRNPRWDLKILYTFTPLDSSGWTIRRLLDPNSPERFSGVEIFNFSLDDLSVSHGGFWTEDQIDQIKAGWKPHERDVRIGGKWGGLGGREYYSHSLIDEAAKRCEAGKRYHISVGLGHVPKLEEADTGFLEIFREPAKGHRYVAGIDTAGGIRRDYSVINVWDRDDLVCVASYRSNTTPPDIFGSQVCVGLGRHYNYSLLVPETNGEHGGTVLAALRSKQYPNIYQRQEWDSVIMDYKNEYGFRTNTRTRSRIFDSFGKHLREGKSIFSRSALEDARFIVVDDNNRPDHVDGYNDDCVVADGVALTVMDDNISAKLPPWSHFKTEVIGPRELIWMGA